MEVSLETSLKIGNNCHSRPWEMNLMSKRSCIWLHGNLTWMGYDFQETIQRNLKETRNSLLVFEWERNVVVPFIVSHRIRRDQQAWQSIWIHWLCSQDSLFIVVNKNRKFKVCRKSRWCRYTVCTHFALRRDSFWAIKEKERKFWSRGESDRNQANEEWDEDQSESYSLRRMWEKKRQTEMTMMSVSKNCWTLTFTRRTRAFLMTISLTMALSMPWTIQGKRKYSSLKI